MSHFSAIISAARNWETSWSPYRARQPGDPANGSAKPYCLADQHRGGDRDRAHVLHAAGDDEVRGAGHARPARRSAPPAGRSRTAGRWSRRARASGSPAASQAVRAMSPACGPIVSHAAEDHVVDRGRVDAGAVHQCRQHVRAEVGRVHAGEAAAPSPTGVRTASTRYASVTPATLPSERLVGKLPACMEPLAARTLPDLRARPAPSTMADREAIVDGDVRLTFAELADEVDRFAAGPGRARGRAGRPGRDLGAEQLAVGRRRARASVTAGGGPRAAEHPVQGRRGRLHPAPQRRPAAAHRRRLPRQPLRRHAGRRGPARLCPTSWSRLRPTSGPRFVDAVRAGTCRR